jgi:hypothetical protein
MRFVNRIETSQEGEKIMDTIVLDQITAAGLIVMIVQWLKNTKWVPWVNEHSAFVTRFVSWTAAFGVATGIHYMYDREAGTLLFTGLSLTTVLTSFWHWLSSIVAQELIYRGVVPSQKEIAAKI